MPAINIDKLSYRELVDLEARVAAAIVERKKEEREELKRKMAEMAASSGFDIDEVLGGKRGTRKGTTVAPKYRHPKDPSLTWSGRGRQPLWLAAEIKKGKKLDGFLIK